MHLSRTTALCRCLPPRSGTAHSRRLRQITSPRLRLLKRHSFASGFDEPSLGEHGIFKVEELGCYLAPSEVPEGLALATFAGGNFWGVQLLFQRLHGVVETTVGYTQGRVPFPCFSMIRTDTTGHVYAVQVTYNPEEVKYEQLVDELLSYVDPTMRNRQREDEGKRFRSGIYYHSEEQKEIAAEKLKRIEEEIEVGEFRATAEQKVVVELKPAVDFYIAEEMHQCFLKKGGEDGKKRSVEKGCKDPIEWVYDFLVL